MISLIKGDCLEVMKSIPDGSIDMILCDLPYGSTDCKWDSIICIDSLWFEYKRITKPTSSIILTAQQPFSSLLTVSNLEWYRHRWIWEKNKCGNFLSAKVNPLKYTEDILVFQKYGYLKSWNNNGKPKGTYNPIMTYVNDDGVNSGQKRGQTMNEINNRPNPSKLKSDPAKDPKSRFPKEILKINLDLKDKVHPTQKPVKLMEYLIKTYTNEGETVLDNCMGSGTTGVACENLNRNFIGIEQDDKYFEIATNRINN